MRKRQASGIVWATIFLAFAQPSHAAEYGWGTYLLGVSIPMMGFTPPPGIYLSDTVYAYQGNAGIGDTVVAALLGWQEGNSHWNLVATGTFPTGVYDPNMIAFLGLHRPSLDVKGAYTYLNPQTGLEISGGGGYNVQLHQLGDELPDRR